MSGKTRRVRIVDTYRNYSTRLICFNGATSKIHPLPHSGKDAITLPLAEEETPTQDDPS